MFPMNLPRILAGAALLAGATTTQAATLLVTVKNDSYDGVCNLHCSLRDAVAVANQSGTANIILLPSGTYVLSRLDPPGLPVEEDDNLTGDLDVVGELRIKGAGPGKSMVSGPDDRYRASTHRLMEVHPGAQLDLERLALKDGRSAHNGGAVENHGSLLLRQVHALENIARVYNPPEDPDDAEEVPLVDEDGGGAIANYGDLIVLASHFEGNFTEALDARQQPTMGGAIYNRGNLVVRNSHFNFNGVDYQPAPYGNGAGAALYNRGRATVERSSFTDNTGMDISEGAIANEGGYLTLTNSTLSNNFNEALTNGLHDDELKRRSMATLTNVTITRNNAFWRNAVRNRGDLLIRNSLIAGNPVIFGSDCSNEGPNFRFQAIGLLLGDAEQSNCRADMNVPDAQIFTQVLSPTATQQSNGTWAHALLPGSPAIDAGIGACINQDQSGAFRPQDGNGDGVALCDLGAIEQ